MTGYPPEACCRIIKERIVVVEICDWVASGIAVALSLPFAAKCCFHLFCHGKNIFCFGIALLFIAQLE
jgi:hypothetical protein